MKEDLLLLGAIIQPSIWGYVIISILDFHYTWHYLLVFGMFNSSSIGSQSLVHSFKILKGLKVESFWSKCGTNSVVVKADANWHEGLCDPHLPP